MAPVSVAIGQVFRPEVELDARVLETIEHAAHVSGVSVQTFLEAALPTLLRKFAEEIRPALLGLGEVTA